MANKHRDMNPALLSMAKHNPVPAVGSDEMGMALMLFQSAAMLQMPAENPEKHCIELGSTGAAESLHDALGDALADMFMVDGSKVRPKDSGVNRGMFTVLEHFKNHPQQMSIVHRLSAFFFLASEFRNGGFGKWERQCEDGSGTEFHPAVIDAAASCPTGKYGEFDKDVFLSTVEEIAKKKYPEEEA